MGTGAGVPPSWRAAGTGRQGGRRASGAGAGAGSVGVSGAGGAPVSPPASAGSVGVRASAGRRYRRRRPPGRWACRASAGAGIAAGVRRVGGRVGRRRGAGIAAGVRRVRRHGGAGILDHDRRHVLARAGVGARGLLLDVGGAVAVGVVEAVADAVAVGVGQRRIGARLELDRVAQAVVVRVLVPVGDAVVVAVGAVRRGAGAHLGAVVEPVAVGVLGGVCGVDGVEPVAALPAVGHPVSVGVGALGGERGGAPGQLDGAAAERDAAAAPDAHRARGSPSRTARRTASTRRWPGRSAAKDFGVVAASVPCWEGRQPDRLAAIARVGSGAVVPGQQGGEQGAEHDHGGDHAARDHPREPQITRARGVGGRPARVPHTDLSAPRAWDWSH